MSVFSLELFGTFTTTIAYRKTLRPSVAPSHGKRLPNPEEDEVVAVFYSYQDSAEFQPEEDGRFTCQSGMIVVENDQVNARRLRNVKFEAVLSELDLLNRLIDVVVEVNPDVVSGWEVQAASWGYLSARASTYGGW